MTPKTLVPIQPFLFSMLFLIAGMLLNPGSSTAHTSSFSGQASWYGGELEGHKTAGGEKFNQNTLTAAHRSLPFGTKVLVKNCRTGHSCIVEVRDRGPHIKGRVIDVSREAARRLHLISCGVGKVECRVLDKETNSATGKSALLAAGESSKVEAK